jgi:hypothetical protein
MTNHCVGTPSIQAQCGLHRNRENAKFGANSARVNDQVALGRRVDHTRRSADLAEAVAKLAARNLVLDGEVAIYDDQLRSRFEWRREPDPDAVAAVRGAASTSFDRFWPSRQRLFPRHAFGAIILSPA